MSTQADLCIWATLASRDLGLMSEASQEVDFPPVPSAFSEVGNDRKRRLTGRLLPLGQSLPVVSFSVAIMFSRLRSQA